MSDRLIRYALDGIKLTHDISFGVTDGDGFDVYVNRTKLDKDLDYDVIGSADELREGDGKITLKTAHAASDVLLILSDTLARRVTNFAKAARFEEAEIDNEFDNLLRLLEDASLYLTSTPYFNPVDIGLVDGQLPPVIAGGVLRVTQDKSGFELILLDELPELQEIIRQCTEQADRSESEADKSKVSADKSEDEAGRAQRIADELGIAPSGDYKGLWPDSGGSAGRGDTWQTQASGKPTGRYFAALKDTNVNPANDDVNWREIVGVATLPNYTDIDYKASGGNSAVDNMLLGNPIPSKIGCATCTGETKWVMKTKSDPVVLSDFEVIGSYYASDFIADYQNPTIEELSTLMRIGGHVLFKSGDATYPDITINQEGNTVWEAIVYGAYNIKGTTSGYLFDTNGNAGICGIKGIRFNGDFKAENIVRFANCNIVYCEQNHAEKITKTNDETKNYRGGFIYLNVAKLIQGGNSCEFIEQNTPTGFPHGQHQSFSYNNIDIIEWNGLANTSNNADKLWHCDGVSKGNTGHHIGKDINDNAMYVLGIPQGITATIDCESYQEGIVFNPSGDSEVNVPYCILRNGSSRVIALRSGAGLNIGTIKSYGSRTGISDDGYEGSTGVTIDYCYMQDITEERALSIVNSGLTINGTMKTINVTSSDFNEVARVSGAANFNCNSFIDSGSGASTCLRINEFTTGSSNITSMKTNKTNKVVYQGGKEFGGKSFIGRLNGFLIQGGAPSTLIVNSGAITILQNSHRIDTEGGAGTDELSTINGAPAIDTIVTLQTLSNLRDVIVKHNTGNIYLPNGADIRLNSTNDTIQLKWNGSYWSKPV